MSQSLEEIAGFEEVVGCDAWVIQHIMQIAELRYWKHEETSKGSLSVIELVKRALAIDHSLTEKRHENKRRITDHSVHTSAIKIVWIINNIFASAAAIYLHATVSEPRPEVEEIERGVSDTVEALRLLPHPRFLKRLTWPVCIAACLANSKHKSFFERLEEGLNDDRYETQNMLRGLELARECWSLRRHSDSKSNAYDWTQAMVEKKTRLLLF